MARSEEPALRELVVGFGSWVEKAAAPARMTSALHPYTRLFSPIRANGVLIKNRLVMAPMGNLQMADELGRPSAKMIRYFEERARGGVGLITSGLVPFGQRDDPTLTEPGGRTYFPRLDTRTTFAGWRDSIETASSF